MKRPPTETTSLLSKTRLSKLAECVPSLPRYSTFANWANDHGITLADIALAGIAGGFACASTAVFWPSSVSFRTTFFGQWLSKHIFDAAILCFISSAPDLFFLTAYLTFAAWPNFKKVYSEQQDPLAKISLVIAVSIFTAIQALQGPAVTYGTGGSSMEIGLAGLGGLPGAFFFATSLVTQHMFSIGRAIDSAYLQASKYLVESLLGTYEKYHVQRELKRLHADLIQRLHAGYSNLLSSHDDIDLACLNGGKEINNGQIAGVWQQMTRNLAADLDYSPQESWLNFIARNAVQVIGISVTAVLCLAFILNMIHIMPTIVPINQALSMTFGMGLSLAATFIFLYLNGGGTSLVYNSLINMMSGKPVENTLYQLHPTAINAMIIFAVLWNWLSWYTSYNLFNKNYSSQWTAKEALLITIIPTIIFYHVVGWMKFVSEMTTKQARNSGDPHKVSLVIQNDALEKTRRMSPSSAIKLVSEQEPVIRRQLLGGIGEAALQQLMRSKVWNTSRISDVEETEEVLTDTAATVQPETRLVLN